MFSLAASRRRTLTALAIGAAVVGLAVLPAAAASAHDELVSSSPAAGEVLAQSPTELALTFSDAPLGTGNAVELRDSAGAVVPVGTPSVDGTTVRVSVPTQLVGEYRLTWKVVSGDGHAASGTIDFGVGAGATGRYTGTTNGTTDAATDANWYGIPRPVMIGVFSIFALGTVVAIIFWVRQLRRGPGN